MKNIQKRVGSNQNIAFISMIVALIGCFSILGSFVPLSAIFIILFIPAISALSIELIENKYVIPFIVSSILITFACSAYDLSCAFFYTVPAIISGTVYGLLHKHKVSDLSSIFLASLIQLTCNYIAIPIINLIYDVDIIKDILTLISLQNSTKVYDFIPAFLFFYSLAEMFLSYIVLYLSKQSLDKQHGVLTINNNFFIPFLGILFSILSCIFIPFYLNVTYLFMLFGMYFGGYCIYIIISNNNKKIYWLTFIMLFLGVFLFIYLYPLAPENSGPSLFNFVTLSISIPAIIAVNNC